MAEFLVFIRTANTAGHWMDKAGVYEALQLRIDNNPNLTLLQKIRKKEILADKYTARNQPGDIIEVHENGFFRDHGWNKRCFAVVRCPPLGLQVAENRVKPYMVGDKVVSKCEYTFASLNLGPGDVYTFSTVAALVAAVGAKHG